MSHRSASVLLLLSFGFLVGACGDERSSYPRPPAPKASPVDSLQQRVAREPDNLDARLALANLLFDNRRHREAIAHYEVVLARRAEDPNIRTDYATCLFDVGRKTEARSEYQRVIRAFPDHINARFNLAVLENSERQFETAAELWETVAGMTEDPAVTAKARQLAGEARRQAATGGGR